MGYSTSPFTVTVAATPTLLERPTTPLGVRKAARLLRNIGANTIYLGGADVAATGALQGYPVAINTDFPDSVTNGAIYGIVAAGTEPMLVWEVSG